MADAYDDVFASSFGKTQSKEPDEYDKVFAASVSKQPESRPVATAEPIDFKGTLRVGPFDTGINLPEGVNRRLAQFGSGMADLQQGISQRFGNATEADTAEKRRIDAQLNDDTTGKVLSVAGKVAPWLAVPAGGVVNGVAIGLASGFLEPTANGDSVGFNTLTSGVLGGVVPAAVSGFKTLAAPSDSLASKAVNQYGIPLNVADISNSKFLKAGKSILDSLPVTGTIGATQSEAKQVGFNRAIGKTIGVEADKLTPDVMLNAKGNISSELNRIWNSNNLVVDNQFIQDLSAIRQKVQNLNPEQQASVNKVIANLRSKVDANNTIPGSFVNNWQSELRMMADGEKGLHQSALSDIRKAAINAFNRSVTGADAQALGTAKTQYGALKTLEPLMNKVEAGTAGRISGDVPAALLPGAVATQYGTRVSQSPFADLAPIAGRFMVDRVPQTGGSVRALMQNAGVGATLAGAGAMTSLPATLGSITAGVAAQGALSPAAAKLLLQQAVPRGLLDKPEVMAALKEIASGQIKRAPIPLGMGLLSTPALE